MPILTYATPQSRIDEILLSRFALLRFLGHRTSISIGNFLIVVVRRLPNWVCVKRQLSNAIDFRVQLKMQKHRMIQRRLHTLTLQKPYQISRCRQTIRFRRRSTDVNSREKISKHWWPIAYSGATAGLQLPENGEIGNRSSIHNSWPTQPPISIPQAPKIFVEIVPRPVLGSFAEMTVVA